MKADWAALALMVAVLSFSGCGFVKDRVIAPNTGGKYYAVSAPQTPFFKYGPQQGNGPDAQLQRDTLLSLIHTSFGYCKVQLTSGEQGFVAREDIKVAPATIIAAVTTPAAPAPASVNQFNINSADPRLVPPPEPLPDSSPEMPVEPEPLEQ